MKLEKLLTHYRGEVAAKYEKSRRNPKWEAEQAAVSHFLSKIGKSSRVLDIPVGTGRFIPVYEQFGLAGVGMDVSPAMLAEAQKKVRGDKIELRTGDIRHIDADAETFDCVVCMRFLNWIDLALLGEVLTELRRVSKKNLIVGIRHLVPFTELGVAGAIAQLKRRFIPKDELIVHKKSDVDELFVRLNLEIVETHSVERHKKGTSYTIYLLRK